MNKRRQLILLYIKSMRRLKYWVLALVLLLFVLLLLPNFLLQLPAVQNYVGNVVEKELGKALGTDLSIGKVEMGWWRSIDMNRIAIKDRAGQPMLRADKLSAGIDLFPLLSGKVSLSTLRLFTARLNVYRAKPDTALNVQFVLDALKSKEPDSESNLQLNINSILLRNCQFRVQGLLSPDDSARTLDNLDAKVQLAVKGSDIESQLRQLRFVERSSGFELKQLSCHFALQKDLLSLRKLIVQLPNSKLTMHSGHLRLPLNVKDIKGFAVENMRAKIALSDLAPFYKPLKNEVSIIDLELDAQSDGDAIQLPSFKLQNANDWRLSSSAALLHYKEFEQMRFTISLQELSFSRFGLLQLQRILPQYLNEEWKNFGSLDLMAVLQGRTDDMHFKARGETEQGSLTLNANMALYQKPDSSIDVRRINGRMSSEGLALNKLFPSIDLPELLSFDCHLQADRAEQGVLALQLQGHLPQIKYQGQDFVCDELDFRLKGQNWNVETGLKAQDAELVLQANGKQIPFSTAASELNLHLSTKELPSSMLKPWLKLPAFETSFAARCSLHGNDLERTEASLQLDSCMLRIDNKLIELGALSLDLKSEENRKKLIQVQSQYLDGELQGQFKYKDLPALLETMLAHYLPQLFADRPLRHSLLDEDSRLKLDLKVDMPKSVYQVLNLPLTPERPVYLSADIVSPLQQLSLKLKTEQLKFNANSLEKLDLNIQSDQQSLSLLSRLDLRSPAQKLSKGIELTAVAARDTVRTQLALGQDSLGQSNGKLSLQTAFSKAEDGLHTHFSLDPSRLHLGDIDWEIESVEASLSKKQLILDNFALSSPGRHLHASGVLSDHPADSIKLDLQRINLSYILNLAGVDFDLIQVDLSGKASVSDLWGKVRMHADLKSDQFFVNGVDVGPIKAQGDWLNDIQHIALKAAVYNPDGSFTNADGFIKPVGDDAGLSLHFDARHANVGFLGPFFTAFSHKFEGRASGKVHFYGPFNELTVAGTAIAEEVHMGIAALNTEYVVSDTLHFTPQNMIFRDLRFRDLEGNTARLDAELRHRGFDQFKIDLKVSEAKKILAYNVPEKENPSIYGKAYASGNVRLYDVPYGLRCDVNAHSEAGSVIGLNFTRPSVADEHSFIRFVERSAPSDTLLSPLLDNPKQRLPAETDDFHLHVNIDVSPDAMLTFIIDPETHTGLKGNPEGSLQLDYHSATNAAAIFGTMYLREGAYDFNLKHLVQKRFTLGGESQIDFAGDPMAAKLKVEAAYNTTANLGDLDESFMSELARTNVPVECLLRLNGSLMRPSIDFDIRLPQSDSELERRVRSLIDTEEMMTRQMLYLLVLGKFFTPDYAYNSGSANTDNWTAVATSTLSQQLNRLLGTLSDKVQIGTSIKTKNTTFDDTDIELLLSSRLLNNRLLINGNFGYRDNPNLRNTYVGEFDLEYKLNRSGSFRLKGFNRFNDMYQYLRRALTTQGVGLGYKYDFDRFFGRAKKPKLQETPLNNPHKTAESVQKQPSKSR